MAISRAGELPATAVDNGDGSWSDSAYPDRTGERETIGALTWENQGRLRIVTPTDAREGETPLYRFTEIDENLLPLAESLVGMTRYSRDGVWKVVAVDPGLLDPELVEQRDAAIRAFQPSDTYGMEMEWIPESWTHEDCENDGGNEELHVWNDEDRNLITSPFTGRQQAAVKIEVSVGGGTARCSGILIRHGWVLTAAHCVVDANEVLLAPEEDFEITAPGQGTLNADEIYVPPGYNFVNNWDHDYEDDWALIDLDGSFDPAIDFDIWSGSDDVVFDVEEHVHNLGYPSWALNGSGACTSNSGLRHLSNAELIGVTAKKVKPRLDSGSGQSGSAYYICADGDPAACGPQEEGDVIGVHAGWNTVENLQVGPKGSAFFAEAQSVLP